MYFIEKKDKDKGENNKLFVISFYLGTSLDLLKHKEHFQTYLAYSNNLFYFSLEVVGRFPNRDEATTLSISQNIPVWLPIGPFTLNSDIKLKLKLMRKAVNCKYSFFVCSIFL